MPLQSNIPNGKDGWVLTSCPQCGAKCWELPFALTIAKLQGAKILCTACALKNG